MRRNVRTGVARDILRLAIIGVWAAEPRGRLAASRPLLHPLGGIARDPHRHRGRRPAGPGRRRLAADLAADGRAAGGGVGRAREPGAPDRARRRRRRRVGSRPGRGQARRAIVAVPPTLAGADRLRPAAAARRDGLSPADGAGQRRQVHGRLRAAVLARARPLGCDHAASPARSRSASTTRRPTAVPGVLLGFLEGRAAREAADLPQARASPAGRRAASAGCSAPRPPTRSTTSTAPGEPTSGRAGCYGGFLTPGAWTDYGRPCASRSARSTGPEPRRRSSGTATWTARSARARTPRPRSTPRSDCLRST